MRIFQNIGIYQSYATRLDQSSPKENSFSHRLNMVIADRVGALHLLKPVLDRTSESFVAIGADVTGQKAWAHENGMKSNSSLEQILLAQIESHATEVFYNLDPITFSNAFVRKLPGCVRKTIAWRAAPSSHHDFNEYDLVVNNFPRILKSLREKGCKTAEFFPAFDPEMESYSSNKIRNVDILFVGSYSRNHKRRSALLEHIAQLKDEFKVVFHLDKSRIVKLAETPLGLIGPLAKYRFPSAVRAIASESVFGRQLYEAISNAKIVLNIAVDMAGDERGNMRCWEAMGCGATMLSDDGIYPSKMSPQRDFLTYDSIEDATQKIRTALSNDAWRSIAERGFQMISKQYSKEVQWEAFCKLAN